MRVTRRQLRRIIKEEKRRLLREQSRGETVIMSQETLYRDDPKLGLQDLGEPWEIIEQNSGRPSPNMDPVADLLQALTILKGQGYATVHDPDDPGVNMMPIDQFITTLA